MMGLVAQSPGLAAQSTAAAGAHPTLEDLFKVKALGGVQMSPDGQQVLYTARVADLEKNQANTDIWLLTLPERARPENIQLTRNPKEDTSPRWRPDGRAFAFLSVRPEPDGKEGKRALYLMEPRGGEPEKLFEHETAITSFEWSPDGRWIGFTAQDPEPVEAKETKDQGRDVAVEDEPGEYTHLWLLDVAAKKARRVTSGAGYSVGRFSVSPDGKAIGFSAAPSPNITDGWRSDIYLVATDSGAAPRKLTDNPGPDDSPVFSPDGALIYYHAMQTDRYRVGQSRVYRMPKDGGTPEDVSPDLDAEPSDYQLTPDGKGAFFMATVGTTRGLFYLPLVSRKAVRLSGGQGVVSQVSFSKDGRRMAYVRESMTKPQELYAADEANQPDEDGLKNFTPLTRHNADAAPWAAGLSDVIRWKSVDGRQIEGILVYPAGWTPARGAAPLVVKIHGGPSGVFVQNFQASSFNADAQRYAADGYAVLLPNPRGSSGYGDATQQAVVRDWGGLDFRDIMTGVDTLIARGIAHRDSLGVMGWSYGGYLTAWTISQTDRFKAAVVGAGITEAIAMWATQDIIHVFEAYFGGTSPWADGAWEVYQKSSPLAHMRNAKTPTLVVHGRNDLRVPPNQAMLLYRTLKALNVPTELLWLPRTGHGPSEPGLQYETAKAQKEWMDRWIRRKGTKPAADGTQ
ncbi:MAG: S9 family peptidase [Gemmatimonadetes bacterium]|nr:S9 family peptidase [Gemmatimonadota bacterium]